MNLMTAFNTFMRHLIVIVVASVASAAAAAVSVAYIRFVARFRLPFASVANFTVDI